MKILRKIFGGLKITWPVIIIMALALGVWTALMALLVPDGNSFHDIAVTMEWWVLPAIIIIVNCKTPTDAALKTFVFFLISQPLVYLIQVPFNSMGWGLFQYYPYWFVITLFTLPAAFIGWFIKKDAWYSGIILSAATTLLAFTGVNYAIGFADHFPNHLITTIYCFCMIPILIIALFKKWPPRILTIVCTIVTTVIIVVLSGALKGDVYEVYTNTFLEENGITLVGEPKITSFFGTADCDADICAEITGHTEDGYFFRLRCRKGAEYNFEIEDESGQTYLFKYAYSDATQSVEVTSITP